MFFRLLVLAITSRFFSSSAHSQQIVDQKKTVAFAFGTVHVPPPSDATGSLPTQPLKPIMVYQPLGTVFFVTYPDPRGGPNFSFGYVVTAKHVLKDVDGAYLTQIDIRLNLRKPVGDDGTDKVTLPVSEDGKNLIWLHDSDDAIDIAAFPFAPDFERFDYRAIPVDMFADDSTSNPSRSPKAIHYTSSA